MDDNLKLLIKDVNEKFNKINNFFVGNLTEDYDILININGNSKFNKNYLIPSKFIADFYSDYIVNAHKTPKSFFISKAAYAIKQSVEIWYNKFI